VNYRHAFHAGNFADVMKHVILTRILVHLRVKPAPFRAIDTHAGTGLYDLQADEAERTQEWRGGAGRLGEPFAAGGLHELQSATKSVTSMLLGIAVHDRAASGVGAKTPVVLLAAAVGYRPTHLDARKRAMTVMDMLTMQSGLAWKESGYAYAPGSGNDVMAMLETGDWAAYVIDRPMATRPGTSFVYNSGAAHLVSATRRIGRRPVGVRPRRRRRGWTVRGSRRWSPRSEPRSCRSTA